MEAFVSIWMYRSKSKWLRIGALVNTYLNWVKTCLALVVKKTGFLNFNNFLFEASLFTIINFWAKILATKLVLSIKVSGAVILLNLWMKR